MTRRQSKWFTIIPPVSAEGMASAVYNGEYQGVPDPIGEGKVGATYLVRILTDTKLEAPDPPFTSGDGFDL